jgi:protein-S-isoprenylcysteine O-methyltransferase Ste14
MIQGKSDYYSGRIGAFLMFGFGVLAVWRWLQTDMLFFMLFALRDFLAAGFMFRRREAVAKGSISHQCIAYLSSALPLLYQGATNAIPPMLATIQSLLVIGGFALVTFATIELGFNMGVSPAKRGQKILTGVYRYLSHPMYTGYVIAELGLVLINPAINGVLFIASVGLYIYRSRLETQILAQKYR